MAGMHHIGNDTIAGTIGGTILAILPQLDTLDVTRTVILAALGAVASFLISQLCKWIWNRIRSKISGKVPGSMFNQSPKGRKSKAHDKK